jgi:hypothetical protein
MGWGVHGSNYTWHGGLHLLGANKAVLRGVEMTKCVMAFQLLFFFVVGTQVVEHERQAARYEARIEVAAEELVEESLLSLSNLDPQKLRI